MNKYRALLVDPEAKQERPVQVFGNDLSEIQRWSETVLTAAVSKDAAVLIYQTIEQQISIVNRSPMPPFEVVFHPSMKGGAA